MSIEYSYSSFVDSLMILVPVIASFTTAGMVKPLYVRIDSESYPVIDCTQISKVGSWIYKCTIDDKGVQKPLELTFHYKEGFWTIPKTKSVFKS